MLACPQLVRVSVHCYPWSELSVPAPALTAATAPDAGSGTAGAALPSPVLTQLHSTIKKWKF